MTVQKLISELKKMPPKLQIYYGHNDNSIWEIAGDICYVSHCVKKEILKDYEPIISKLRDGDKANVERLPKQWVIIRG